MDQHTQIIILAPSHFETEASYRKYWRARSKAREKVGTLGKSTSCKNVGAQSNAEQKTVAENKRQRRDLIT